MLVFWLACHSNNVPRPLLLPLCLVRPAVQVVQFFGLAWIWFYVHLIYVWTSFMVGYDKARGRNKEKQAAAAAASGSKEAAGKRKKAK